MLSSCYEDSCSYDFSHFESLYHCSSDEIFLHLFHSFIFMGVVKSSNHFQQIHAMHIYLQYMYIYLYRVHTCYYGIIIIMLMCTSSITCYFRAVISSSYSSNSSVETTYSLTRRPVVNHRPTEPLHSITHMILSQKWP